MIKKILIFLMVVLNLMLPLSVFAKEEVTDLKEPQENVELEKGQGSVVETATDNSKDFFTIMTENGATFYLVVDKNKSSENVYFLKTVDEVDLMKLAGGNAVIYEETTQATTETITEMTTYIEESKQNEKSSFNFFSIFIILGIILLVGVLVYDKFLKGKVKNSNFDDDFEEDDEKEPDKKTTIEDLDGFINKK